MTRKFLSSGAPAFGPLVFAALTLALAFYFTFAAVQGDYGLFRRAEIKAEANDLRLQLDAVCALAPCQPAPTLLRRRMRVPPHGHL